MTASWMELRDEVHAWSTRNYPRNTARDHLEGVAKEIGNLAHARLKGRRGISWPVDYYLRAERDALGHGTVCLLGYCGRAGYDPNEFADSAGVPAKDMGPDTAFSLICWRYGCLMSSPVFFRPEGISISTPREDQARQDSDRLIVSMLTAAFSGYARARGWDLIDVVRETWSDIRRGENAAQA